MEIYKRIEDYAKTGYESQVALGFFDGVHLGHRAVIDDCIADKGERKAVVLTFSDSPARLMGNHSVRLITDNARKAELIARLGADVVIFADFLTIKDMQPDTFITDVLHKQFHAKKVSCGYNYRFGKFGGGNTETLKALCGALDIEVSVKEPVDMDGRSVSSTSVRELLQSGDISGANRMLGYPYAVVGRIGSGNHLGTGMGYPTVNLPIGDGLVIPRFGVYASQITVGGKTYRGATNIGVHPTVGENASPLCETFLTNFEGEELYGKDAVCELLAFIRPEKKFASKEALTAQIAADIAHINTIMP